MKQIQCVMWIKADDGTPWMPARPGVVVGTREGECVAVEMHGELPEPGRWVKGEPEHSGAKYWWRWAHGVPALCWWSGKGWALDCGAYYWTGDDKPTEAPPSEAERTCEIRWVNGSGWVVSRDDGWCLSGEPKWDLDAAKAKANGLEYRVTNDPREVVLIQHSYGDNSWRYRATGGFESGGASLEDWRAECAKRGWRILREEAAEQRPTLGEMVERWARRQRTSCSIPNYDPDPSGPNLVDVVRRIAKEIEAIGRDRR